MSTRSGKSGSLPLTVKAQTGIALSLWGINPLEITHPKASKWYLDVVGLDFESVVTTINRAPRMF